MWRHGANVPPEAIGFVDSPYKDTAAIPKGLGAKHDAEGILRILPEFEVGFTDFEGFSHLIGSRHSTAPRLRSAWHTPLRQSTNTGCLPRDRHAVQIRLAFAPWVRLRTFEV